MSEIRPEDIHDLRQSQARFEGELASIAQSVEGIAHAVEQNNVNVARSIESTNANVSRLADTVGSLATRQAAMGVERGVDPKVIISVCLTILGVGVTALGVLAAWSVIVAAMVVQHVEGQAAPLAADVARLEANSSLAETRINTRTDSIADALRHEVALHGELAAAKQRALESQVVTNTSELASRGEYWFDLTDWDRLGAGPLADIQRRLLEVESTRYPAERGNSTDREHEGRISRLEAAVGAGG